MHSREREGKVTARCHNKCDEGTWLHGFHHIQCKNGEWEKYVPKRSLVSVDPSDNGGAQIVDMDIDLVEPICIDHCPCQEANSCQVYFLSKFYLYFKFIFRTCHFHRVKQ